MGEPILSTLASALEILSKFIQRPSDKLDRNYGNAKDNILKALRHIYFTPNGLRSLLVDLSEGRQPSQATIQSVLGDFNDAEWSVRSSLWDIEFENLVERREITLHAAKQLEGLRYSKTSVRRELQEKLNEELTQGHIIDPGTARLLLSKVDELNLMIETLEQEHNYRARGR